MKSKEELAEEYRDLLLQNGERVNVFDAFLAGYEAGREQGLYEPTLGLQLVEAAKKYFKTEDK